MEKDKNKKKFKDEKLARVSSPVETSSGKARIVVKTNKGREFPITCKKLEEADLLWEKLYDILHVG